MAAHIEDVNTPERVMSNGTSHPNNHYAPLEKDFSRNGHTHLHPDHDSSDALHRIRTAGSISISPEMFEKLYLTPQHPVHGDLRKTFGNPTPLAIVGFLVCLMPLSCDLMGWRGAGGNGAAGTGTYFYLGGLCMVLGGIGEWIIGNTFPFVVFTSFGGFWLSWGATLHPSYNAYGAYSTTGNPADGLHTVGFRSSLAFFQLSMAILCFVYLILSLRTNICFFIIFLGIVPDFCFLAAAQWQTDNGNLALAGDLHVAAGACGFVACIAGWYILLAIMMATLEFPWDLPVGDLSQKLLRRKTVGKEV